MSLHRCYALRDALAVTFAHLERCPNVCSQSPQPLSRQFCLRELAGKLREELQTATMDIHYNFFHRVDAMPCVKLVLDIRELLAHHCTDAAVAVRGDRSNLNA